MIIGEERYLEHYGVKGMRWGVRNDRRPGGTSNRQKNKASRAKDKAERKREIAKNQKKIDIARGRVASGKTKATYKKVKSEHKANKRELGSREARKILNKAKEKRYNEIEKSKEVRDGKELVRVLLIGTLGNAIARNQEIKKAS